ncbi:YwgA family protein [Virgibacillus halodenitrificans]|uniref:YwgA family protein n=1 Tax=Virgibacillus halodenitrificans TaxID=1482 RepID=UPI0024C0398F|nr:YwgA family protein [Virgibacillus halodenitrificans]WHX25966.1 YwgA family protein [Virgibacillus halodenitrificans]
MLSNHAKLMQFFSVAKEVTGRKKLQKMIYILQKCEVPFEEKYQFHFYGPYSEELTLRVEELCNLGFIEEVKEEKSNYYQYNYAITDDGKGFLNQFRMDMPDFSEQVGLLQGRSSRFLELVSTMLYFDYLPSKQVVDKVHTVKPKQKYSEQEIQEANEFIHKLKH